MSAARKTNLNPFGAAMRFGTARGQRNPTARV
jgi:hypothetical protein